MAKQSKLTIEHLGPKLSEATVREFERKQGVALPTEYRNWLLEDNGGRPTPGNIKYKKRGRSFHRAHVSVLLSLDAASADGLEQEFVDLRSTARIPKDLICIAHDGTGNRICLSFAGPKAGQVFLWDHELEVEEGEEPTYDNCFLVAKTFAEFLQMLASPALDKTKEASQDRQFILQGRFPQTVDELCALVEGEYPDVRKWLIARCVKLCDAKAGKLFFHGDPLSQSFLDMAFWLRQTARGAFPVLDESRSCPWLQEWYRSSERTFGLPGYAPGFVERWRDDRVTAGLLVRSTDDYRFTDDACRSIVASLESEA